MRSSTIGSEFIKPDNIGALGLDYTNLVDPRTGENMNREVYDQIVAEDPAYIIVLCIPAREEWLPMWLEVPHMTVAGDQMPPVDAEGNALTWDDPFEKYNGHPRTVGTHAKVLRLAREYGVPLMQALARRDYRDIAAELLDERRQLGFPPCASVVMFRADAAALDAALDKLEEIRSLLNRTPGIENVSCIGPLPALMTRVERGG